MNNVRGNHVSPGIYTKEIDVKYAPNSMGITTLGLAGETLKGPAFQPVSISKWDEFVDYFGGTSAEKDSEKKVKYELPYIAKEYLKESKQLEVVRTLGLSGYDAGPAWVLSIKKGDSESEKAIPFAVLRSKGKYSDIDGDICNQGTGDSLNFKVDSVNLELGSSTVLTTNCATGNIEEVDIDSPDADVDVWKTVFDPRRFQLVINLNSDFSENGNDVINVNVSTIPGDNSDILNTFGSNPNKGNYPLFVEEYYESVFNKEYERIYNEVYSREFNKDIFAGFHFGIENAEKNKAILVKENVGKRFINGTGKGINKEKFDGFHKGISEKEKNSEILKKENVGKLYIKENGLEPAVVEEKKQGETKTVEYVLTKLDNVKISNDKLLVVDGNFYEYSTNKFVRKDSSIDLAPAVVEEKKKGEDSTEVEYVLTKLDNAEVSTEKLLVVNKEAYEFKPEDNKFVKISPTINISIDRTEGFGNYKTAFKEAVTPWFVSEARGDGKKFNVKKLFRFHTISDGNAANDHIKISIANIEPEDGTFDVLVRDFYDTDEGNAPVLERFAKCSMNPMSENYVGLKIGTYDNVYELRSKYIIIEISDRDDIYNTVPAGFLGYPLRNFGTGYEKVPLTYNTTVKVNVNPKRQYFGISDTTGIDIDAFQYKGVENSEMEVDNLCDGFHLDERLQKRDGLEVTVDGKAVNFVTASSKGIPNNKPGVIYTEAAMKDTIFEKKSMRKFTVCPFGGFDGWDIYREKRTNTDEFRSDKYNASTFESKNPLGLPTVLRPNNSDYYAYLASYYAFSNPEDVDINLFATPGIDWKENSSLVKDTIDMIEDFELGRGGDAFYIISSPRDLGENGDASEMSQALVNELEDTGIDSSYAGTFWPWIKYYDSYEKTYVDLPVTKDFVRNLAYIDNNFYPWFAPAGKTEKGKVDCVRATYATRINEEDTLYEGRINPVKTFAVDGVKIWGNKTLYSVNSPLNRINVRRLMIRIKKMITRACGSLIFEPNDMTVRKQFISIVNGILDEVVSQRGITEYRVDVDSSPEAIDEHRLPAKIWVKPTTSLEYIELTFVITPQGASFTD